MSLKYAGFLIKKLNFLNFKMMSNDKNGNNNNDHDEDDDQNIDGNVEIIEANEADLDDEG